jgi:hypothetical protein
MLGIWASRRRTPRCISFRSTSDWQSHQNTNLDASQTTGLAGHGHLGFARRAAAVRHGGAAWWARSQLAEIRHGRAVGVSSPQPGPASFSAAWVASALDCQIRAQTERLIITWEAARCSAPTAGPGVATREPSAGIISGDASSMVCIVDEGDCGSSRLGPGP